MADFFGYDKTIKGPGHVAGTNAVIIKIDNRPVQLAQSCSISYQRNVNQHYELGSDNIYMTAGHPSGSCSISRLIGETAAFVPYKTGACDLSNISVAKGNASCSKDIGTITIQGLLSSISTEINVGTFTVNDTAQYTVGNLVVSQ